MPHLLIIDLPGGNDPDILRSAAERGDAFSFLTSDLSCYRAQPALTPWLDRAHALIEVPGFAPQAVQERVLAVHEGCPIHAVLCLIDIRLVEAARLARALGTPHITEATAALLRDKYSVRCRLQARGIRQPDFALAESNLALRQAVQRLGLPLVIKPADGYGSQNIVALRDEADLDPLLSPLDDLLPSRADYGLGVKANDRLLVERCLQGTVIGCDTLSLGGRHRLLGVHEKQFFEPPSFAIRGGCFTPAGPQHAAIERQVFEALDAVGFDTGAAHTELMLQPEGDAQIIEINGRIVGAGLPRLLNMALGRDLHSDLIELHMGRWPALDASAKTPQVVVTRWIVASASGSLQSVRIPSVGELGEAAADARAGDVRIDMLRRPGDWVRPPLDNADRIGCVMVRAPTQALAERRAEALVTMSRVEVAAAAALPVDPCEAEPA